MNEPKFLDNPPDHSYEPTCEFKWMGASIEDWQSLPTFRLNVPSNTIYATPPVFVLCQRFQGTFKDVWVRVTVA